MTPLPRLRPSRPAAGAWAVARPAPALAAGPARLAVALVLLALGVVLVMGQHEVRVIEAAAARAPLAVLVGRAVHVPGTDLVFYPDYRGPGLRALKVTLSCSSVPLVAPLALLGGVLAIVRRLDPRRVLVGVVLAVAAVFAVNLVRILLIAVSTSHFGLDGYEVSHRIVGSAVTVAGACVAFMVTYRVVSSVAHRPRLGR